MNPEDGPQSSRGCQDGCLAGAILLPFCFALFMLMLSDSISWYDQFAGGNFFLLALLAAPAIALYMSRRQQGRGRRKEDDRQEPPGAA